MSITCSMKNREGIPNFGMKLQISLRMEHFAEPLKVSSVLVSLMGRKADR